MPVETINDPGLTNPKPKDANLSPIMQARARTSMGMKSNFCPYGCNDQDLDDHWYCIHLIGFSRDTKWYEPMVLDAISGRRIVRVREVIKNGKSIRQLERVLPTDILKRITDSYRVYRDVPVEKTEEPEDTGEIPVAEVNEIDGMTEEQLERRTRPEPKSIA